MKKCVLALLVALSFVSCSREEEKPSTNKPSFSVLVGVWNPEKTIIFNGKDNSVINEIFPVLGCEDKSSFEFTGEGKYSYTVFLVKNGECIQQAGINQGTYEYNPDTKKIKIKDNRGEEQETELTFSGSDNFQILTQSNVDYNNDGVVDKVIVSYKRQK